ncbi:MAG: Na+:solute symporter, partial [Bacteroidales bacterium]|nr:Na+:solute symporter [Bacteroidales bacterium]
VLQTIDWIILAVFFVILLSIGFLASRNAGRSAADFFLSGRNMPWWLLGVSMVATTFSCDTPNLVTDLVRQHGVAGNWAWWAFLLTGMLTVFIYAKLWRRSGVLTDLEFYEIRYSGRLAAFLRGFRAIYLGAFFNVMVIATVSLALIKIGAVMLHWSAEQTLIIASVVVLIYATIGGLKSILLTDFFQFGIAMTGAIGAAIILLKMPEVGGLSGLIHHEAVIPKLNLLPDFSDTNMLIILLIMPLAVQWWSVWYPGAEPGGGGYIAQRMLSAKNEKGAMGATLLFNTLHYALRPWPWILVALISLIVFPDIASMRAAFPDIDPSIVKNDFAYPAMLSMLPKGFLGLVVASLIAAFMSTTASQLNWGSSYIANDFYRRFLKPDATEKQVVMVGRISTVVLMILAGLFALILQNALQAFHILLQIGAGTGLIYILRWFWWRINAYTEITGMIVSFVIALFFEFVYQGDIATHWVLLIGVGITTVSWVAVTLLTKPVEKEKLRSFYSLVHPGGPGWKKVIAEAEAEGKPIVTKETQGWDVPTGILCMLLGSFSVYFLLFATGYYIYGNYVPAIALTIAAAATIILLTRTWRKLKMD